MPIYDVRSGGPAMSALLRVAMCLPLLAVAGCASLREAPGVSYAKSVTQLGINPVYPPREDIQVGDIYAIEAHSYATRLTAKTAYLATNDMTAAIRAYLDSRYKFKASDVDPAKGETDEALKRAQADAYDQKLIAMRHNLPTLPVDGFPAIEVDSGITVGVGGQPQGLGVALGFTAAKTLKMSLQFGQVTSYEVPMPVGVDSFDSYCTTVDPQICAEDKLVYWLNQKYQLGPKDPGYVKAAYALMVTKVYLARQITYTFNDATLAAAAAKTVNKSGSMAPDAPTVTSDQINSILATKNPELITAMGSLIQSVNSSTASQTQEGGGSFSLAAVNKDSVSITQIFARPVVVGYEGVSIDD